MKSTNPLAIIKKAAKKFSYEDLISKNSSGYIFANEDANSGKQAIKDIPRSLSKGSNSKSKAYINGKRVACNFTESTDGKFNGIKITLDGQERYFDVPDNISHFELAKEAWRRIFESSVVPDDKIIDELVRNFHQAGYIGVFAFGIFNNDDLMNLFANTKTHYDCDERETRINCNDGRSITMEMIERYSLMDLDTCKKSGKISNYLKFTIDTEKGGIEYKDGELSLSIPEEFKSMGVDGKTLFDIIVELFNRLCDKLGFTITSDTNINRTLGESFMAIEEVGQCAHDLEIVSLEKEVEEGNTKHHAHHAHDLLESRKASKDDHIHG